MERQNVPHLMNEYRPGQTVELRYVEPVGLSKKIIPAQ